VGDQLPRTPVLGAKVGEIERVFVGTFQHTIDDKGRLTLPAKWRDELESDLVITYGLDECLFVFAQSRFKAIAEKVVAQGFESPNARDWSRYFLGNAETIELDKQGRVLISQHLRAHFGLNGEVVVVGLFDRIEIWEPKKHQAMSDRITAEPSAIAERWREMMQNAK
jgi:MraZ protein